MISHQAYLVLSTCTPQTCKHALRLFGEYDLSVPRLLVAEELDKRFDWAPGTTQRLLNQLFDLEILVSLSHGRISAGGHSLWMIGELYTWSPRSLADQWDRDSLLGDRVRGARIQPPTVPVDGALKR